MAVQPVADELTRADEDARAPSGPPAAPAGGAGPAADARDRPADRPAVASGRPSASGQVLRGALALVSTQPLTWAATLLVTIFVPRFLSDVELGTLGIVQAAAALAGTVLALGVPTVLVRDVAARPARGAIAGTTALALLVGVGTLAALALVAGWTLFGSHLAAPDLFALGMAGMVLGQASAVAVSILVGRQRHLAFAWLNAASTATVSALGVGVLALGGGPSGYLLASLLGAAAVAVVGWRIAGVSIERAGLAPAALLRMARAGLPFLGMAVANRIRIDLEVLYLGLLVGQGAVGLWSAAGRIAAIPLFVPTLIVTPLLPALARAAAEPAALGRALRRSLEVALLLTLAPSAGIVAVAPAVPGLLGWDASYDASAPVIAIVAASIPLTGAGMVLGTGLAALGMERRWLAVGVAVSVAHGVLSVALIALGDALGAGGAVGLGAARLATEVLMVGGALHLLPRGILDRSTALFVGRAGLAAVALVVAARALLELWLPLAVVGGALAYGAALLALRAVTMGDLRAAAGLASGGLRRRLGRAA